MLVKVVRSLEVVALVVALMTGGCGGGGGNQGDPASTVSPSPSVTIRNPSLPTATSTTMALPTSTPTDTVSTAPTVTASTTPIATQTATPQSTSTSLPSATVTAIGTMQDPCPATATAVPTITPLPTATTVPLSGPQITTLGVADATGAPVASVGPPNGIGVYPVHLGSGFILFIEGRPGDSGLDVGDLTTNHSPFDPTVRPDLQIEANRNLGDGSTASCDNSAPTLGGIPGIDPPDFSVTQTISDALNDFACRFSTFDASQFPCTQDGSGNFVFVDPSTTRQFCLLISNAIAFPSGDTLITAQLRDSGGSPGPVASALVRVQ